MARLEKVQSKLVKVSLGLHKFCRSSPLLSALGVDKIETTVDKSSLALLKQIVDNCSGARHFYIHLLHLHSKGLLLGHQDLVSRCSQICNRYCLSLLEFLFIDDYAGKAYKHIKSHASHEDGLSDSVRFLLESGEHDLVKLILKSF